jgi:hypothetical protein
MIQEILNEKIVEREFYLKQIENFVNAKIIKVLI